MIVLISISLIMTTLFFLYILFQDRNQDEVPSANMPIEQKTPKRKTTP
ncbi:hypothetical protein PEPS_31580 (plasmid) [Persicobacter psychrovividus]|uniref:Uncharacterized protein n=1 Tax=Persicobacter psychrovividus TaxID=387638 RepID=A0ABN6LCD6_9BACT|nr:hypothetical protein PEPS_31580 [Persicobacter psychrovividus]